MRLAPQGSGAAQAPIDEDILAGVPYHRRVGRRWLGGPALSIATSLAVGCSPFTAESASDDAGVPVDGGAEAGVLVDGGPDAGRASPCSVGTWTLCDDFEAGGWSPRWMKGVVRASDSIAVVADPTLAGNHVLEASARTGTAVLVQLNTRLASSGPEFAFSMRVRVASLPSGFSSTSYLGILGLSCGPLPLQRAGGVILDNRGLTLQLDTNDGEYQGFASDASWHTVEVVRSSAGSRVLIDSKVKMAGAGHTVDGDCFVDVGIAGSTEPTPDVVVHIDDLRIR